jgi:hypothetical protein
MDEPGSYKGEYEIETQVNSLGDSQKGRKARRKEKRARAAAGRDGFDLHGPIVVGCYCRESREQQLLLILWG